MEGCWPFLSVPLVGLCRPLLEGAVVKHTEDPVTGEFQFDFKDKELKNHLRVRRAKAGYVIVTIEAGCRPEKRGAEWHKKMLALMGQLAYRREILIDWSIASGSVYYHDFVEKPEKYVYPAMSYDPALPIYRGWDFGVRRPACLWMQKIGKDRLNILREFQPENVDPYSFGYAVMYLSGQLSLEQLSPYPRAKTWVDRYRDEQPSEFGGVQYDFPKPPWFKPGAKFVDFSGPECYAVNKLEGEKGERNDYEILQSLGIQLNVLSQRVSARAALIRRLLLLDESEVPYLRISPHCKILVEGLSGGIAFKKETDNDPEPEAPAKDGYYEHLHDCLGYAAINLFPVGVEQDPKPLPAATRGEVYEQQELIEQLSSMMDPTILEDPADQWG